MSSLNVGSIFKHSLTQKRSLIFKPLEVVGQPMQIVIEGRLYFAYKGQVVAKSVTYVNHESSISIPHVRSKVV